MAEPATTAKLGIALSGGGFRAAFFHFGVLAEMAVLGLLRHVEVISTVSGGSTIGAVYYLHVRNLLETKTDTSIRDDDYLNIMRKIEIPFFETVQRNMRLLTFAGWKTNRKMFQADYSRSDRLGELFDELLFRPIWQELERDKDTPIQMRQLFIRPASWEGDQFRPAKDNVSRAAKVPVLILNATTLNTGHDWRFEAQTMGELRPDTSIARDIDRSLQLLRAPSYDDMASRQQDTPLGHAVAASAAVPGLLHPLEISDLYPNLRVELADGGVFDNQGVDALIDHGCTHFIVSDAGGQMAGAPKAGSSALAVLTRASAIQYGRVRQAQLSRLAAAAPKSAGSPQVALLHTSKGVPHHVKPWLGENNREAAVRDSSGPSEEFGVHPKVQELLAGIRTDLDAFSEVEAFSLMTDGYRMAGNVIPTTPGFGDLVKDRLPASWYFLAAERWVSQPPEGTYGKRLRQGKNRFGKPFRVSLLATLIGLLWLAVLMGALVWGVFLVRKPLHLHVLTDWLRDPVPAWWLIGVLIVVPLLMYILIRFRLGKAVTGSTTEQLPRVQQLFRVMRFIVAVGSMVYVWISLTTLQPFFVRAGKLDRLSPPPESPTSPQ